MVRGHCNIVHNNQDGNSINVHKWTDKESVPYNEILLTLKKE